jgi:hypothetical protein
MSYSPGQKVNVLWSSGQRAATVIAAYTIHFVEMGDTLRALVERGRIDGMTLRKPGTYYWVRETENPAAIYCIDETGIEKEGI